MSHEKAIDHFEYYQKLGNWDFDRFGIHTRSLTDWDLYEILKSLSTPDSRILDLGTGGGEKLLANYPDCKEILGTDYSPEMIKTARENLRRSGRKNITFKVMDNHKMDVPEDYFDIVVARHTTTDPVQIRKCLKPGGHLLIRGVDKYDCWGLKFLFGGGQGFNDPVPVSIADYENVLKAGFKDVVLVPIHEQEFFKDPGSFREFLQTVPILEGVDLKEDHLQRYISENTFGGKIRLIRSYYGLTARK
ncbi:MAG: class I SAM-dependent methyltransferase [Clostridiales bacterium]|nr:class I SAM-dependent methyltransferase [Clostridiales bacterium]